MMTYIPLARKWRPKSFSDFIGQEHVVRPLQNSLLQNKLHHAYLFTGIRGVGKTTIARIFAKALNCQQGIVAEPCLQCENCLAIDEGRFFDLIEVDGASRTRVEDTRELIENIQYAPAQGRFKIFLIDEVHMLSTHSFNALLKTLEEPPEHVKFLLATTDPQKIPATILSRCLSFHLKPMTSVIIEQQLAYILQQESFPFESKTLELIAQNAHGSMRDALTLCEQIMSMFPQGFEYLSLATFIGHTLREYSLLIMDAFLAHNTQRLMEILQQLAPQQPSYEQMAHLIMSHFHECTLLQILAHDEAPDVLKQCAKQWTTSQLHTVYQILEQGTQFLSWAPNPLIGFQMLMLRTLHALYLMGDNPQTPEFEPEPLEEPEPFEEPEPTPEPETPTPNDPIDNWSSIVDNVPLEGMGKTALSHTILLEQHPHLLILEVHPTYQALFTPNIIERVEQALSAYLKNPIKIKFQAATQPYERPTPAEIKADQIKNKNNELQQKVNNNAFVSKIISECQAKITEIQ